MKSQIYCFSSLYQKTLESAKANASKLEMLLQSPQQLPEELYSLNLDPDRHELDHF